MTLVSSEPSKFSEDLKGLTVPEYLLREANRHSKQNGDKALLVDAASGEEVKYKDFDRLTGNLAAWFHSQGLRKGDMVLFMARKTTKMLLFINGVWRANAIAHATYEQDLPDVILERVLQNNIKFVYCDEAAIPRVQQAAAGCPWKLTIITNDKTPDSVSLNEILETAGTPPPFTLCPQDMCTVHLTSGSTGKPKGSWRTHESWIHIINTCTYGSIFVNPYDKLLVSSSPVHMTGMELPALGLIFGSTVVMQVDCTPPKVLESISKYKAKAWFTFSALVNDVMTHPDRSKFDLTSLQNIALGGSLVITELYEKIRSIVPNVSIVYGSSEVFFTAPRRSLQPDGIYVTDHRKGLEVGKVIPDHSFQIRDVDTDELLGPNQSGEVCAKGPTLFGGYLNLPEKTAEAFTSDSYYRMGDRGYYDEEGVLYVQGRIKDVFKFYNNHISPDEIDVVVGSHPAVRECVTFGVEYHEQEFTPRTLVVLKEGASATSEEIRQFAHERLPEYKHIRGGLYILDSLPRTASDKISRPLASKVLIPNARVDKTEQKQFF